MILRNYTWPLWLDLALFFAPSVFMLIAGVAITDRWPVIFLFVVTGLALGGYFHLLVQIIVDIIKARGNP